MLICGAKHLKVDLPPIDKVVLTFQESHSIQVYLSDHAGPSELRGRGYPPYFDRSVKRSINIYVDKKRGVSTKAKGRHMTKDK